MRRKQRKKIKTKQEKTSKRGKDSGERTGNKREKNKIFEKRRLWCIKKGETKRVGRKRVKAKKGGGKKKRKEVTREIEKGMKKNGREGTCKAKRGRTNSNAVKRGEKKITLLHVKTRKGNEKEKQKGERKVQKENKKAAKNKVIKVSEK